MHWLWLPIICVLNASSVPSATVERWTAAVQRQVHEQLAPAWGVDATLHMAPCNDTDWIVRLTDHDPQGWVGGYHHHAEGGRPVADVYVKDNKTPSVAFSHETIETIVNPGPADRYIDTGKFLFIAEPADPVEGDKNSYTINGVRVSDFVWPSWFDMESPYSVQYDQAKRVKFPGQFLGGHLFAVLTSAASYADIK